MKKILIRLSILLGIVVALFVLLRYTPLAELLDLKRTQENRDQLIQAVRDHFLWAALIFIAGYIAVVAFSIPGATVLSITGGFFFGPVVATLFINIGATIGALGIFLAARYILGNSIQRKYADQLARFNRELEQNGKNYLLTLRLIPIFPFFLINLMAGFTNIKTRTFLWTTAVGIIPGSFVYAYLGYTGATIKEGESMIPPQILIALVLLGLLSLIPVLVRKFSTNKGADG